MDTPILPNAWRHLGTTGTEIQLCIVDSHGMGHIPSAKCVLINQVVMILEGRSRCGLCHSVLPKLWTPLVVKNVCYEVLQLWIKIFYQKHSHRNQHNQHYFSLLFISGLNFNSLNDKPQNPLNTQTCVTALVFATFCNVLSCNL